MSTLATHRLSKKITQEEMAKKLGIAVSTYNQYENSHRNIPTDIAIKIAEILNTDVSKIFLPTKFTVSKINLEK